MTSETAWLFAQALDTSPQFWMNLQAAYDLACSKLAHVVEPVARA